MSIENTRLSKRAQCQCGEVVGPAGSSFPGARLQIPQLAERADDPPADFLEDRGDVGVRGWGGVQKPRFLALGGAIDKHAREEDHGIMEIRIEASTEALQKGHRA